MRRAVMAAAAVVMVTMLGAALWPADACVGKAIFVGRLPGKEQEIMAEIFSWMVGERTGTTIQTKAYADSRAMQTALQGADVDLYLEDQGVALREILGLPASGSPADLRETVRREYEQRFNLIWLEPWGMTGRPVQVSVAGPGGPAASSWP